MEALAKYSGVPVWNGLTDDDHPTQVLADFMTLKEQWAAPIEELLEELNQRGEMVTFLGDGVPVFRELIAEKLQVPYSFAPAHVNKQRAAAVAALGSIYYKEGRTETAMEHIPEYLRVSQAERERAEREKEQKPAGTKI